MSARARIAAGLAAALCSGGALTGCEVSPYGGTGQEAKRKAPAEEVTSLDLDNTDAPTYIDTDPEALGIDVFSMGLDVNRDAEQTAAAYGLVYGNWSWSTFSRQHREMAKLAIGSLRRRLVRNRPDEELLASLARSEQMNVATLVATDTVAADRSTRTVIVVLRERAIAGNLSDPAAQHVVYRAKVVATSAGWRLVKWELLVS